MKEFRLYWSNGFDGQPRMLPQLIQAEGYQFRRLDGEHSLALLEFFINNNVVATFTNFPEGITFDEGIAAPSSVPE